MCSDVRLRNLMTSEKRKREHADSAGDGPWWRSAHVAFAIGFRAIVIGMIATGALLVFWIGREWMGNGNLTWSAVARVIEQSFVGCIAAGAVMGLGLGVPLGVVHVLSLRAARTDLEQELDSRR